MHHCLETPELLQYVLEYTEKPIALLNLALTCKTFSNSALDSLWSVHSDLKAVLKLLPEDALQFSTYNSHLDIIKVLVMPFLAQHSLRFTDIYFQSLARPAIHSDLSPLRKYAHLLRTITLISPPFADREATLGDGPVKSPTISQNLLHELNELSSFQELFPNVRTILCQSINIQHTPFWIFLTPNTKELDIQCAVHNHTQPQIGKVLDTIPRLSPNLRSFKWDHGYLGGLEEPMVGFNEMISNILLQYKSLHEIDVSHVVPTSKAIKHVLGIPELESLAWGLEPRAQLPPVGTTSKSLRHYRHMHRIPVSYFMQIASLLVACKLETLYITLHPLRALQLQETLTFLRNNIDVGTLTNFTIAIGVQLPIEPTPSEDTVFNIRTLSPLLSFKHLRKVEVSIAKWIVTACSLDLDDKSLETMASSWPHLEILRLMDWNHTKIPKVTLNGLLALAKQCPNLRELGIGVNFKVEISRVDQIDTTALGCCPELTILELDGASVKDAKAPPVVGILARIFPNITRMY